MDIFTQGDFFSHHVLTLAKVDILVKYSACALAAKQMGQMNEPTSRVSTTAGRMLVMQAIDSSQNDYLWYGAKYYERAIQLLTNEIQHHSIPNGFPSSLSDVYRSVDGSQAAHSPASPRGDNSTLVAACLLIEYERLSATTKAWCGHIGGVAKMLKLHDPEAFSQPSPRTDGSQPAMAHPTVQPFFWYFALNDVESSRKCGRSISSGPKLTCTQWSLEQRLR